MKILNPNQELVNQVEYVSNGIDTSKVTFEDFNIAKENEEIEQEKGFIKLAKRLLLVVSGAISVNLYANLLTFVSVALWFSFSDRQLLWDMSPVLWGMGVGILINFLVDLKSGVVTYKSKFSCIVCQEQFQHLIKDEFCSSRITILNSIANKPIGFEFIKAMACLPPALMLLAFLGQGYMVSVLGALLLGFALYYPISGNGKFTSEFGGVFICSEKNKEKYKMKHSGRTLLQVKGIAI